MERDQKTVFIDLDDDLDVSDSILISDSETESIKTEGNERNNALLLWLPNFLVLTRTLLENVDIKVLGKVITTFTKHVSKDVAASYSKPNRAAKVKQCISKMMCLFHISYTNIDSPFKERVYMEQMSSLLTMYVDMELKASRRGKESPQKISSKVSSLLYILLNGSAEYILDTILNSRYIAATTFSEICIPIFKKVTNDSKPQHYITYVRYLLIYKLWKRFVARGKEQNNLNRLAVEKLSPPSPKLLEMINKGQLEKVLPVLPNKIEPELITRFYLLANFNLRNSIKEFMKLNAELHEIEPTVTVNSPIFLGDEVNKKPIFKDCSFVDKSDMQTNSDLTTQIKSDNEFPTNNISLCNESNSINIITNIFQSNEKENESTNKPSNNEHLQMMSKISVSESSPSQIFNTTNLVVNVPVSDIGSVDRIDMFDSTMCEDMPDNNLNLTNIESDKDTPESGFSQLNTEINIQHQINGLYHNNHHRCLLHILGEDGCLKNCLNEESTSTNHSFENDNYSINNLIVTSVPESVQFIDFNESTSTTRKVTESASEYSSTICYETNILPASIPQDLSVPNRVNILEEQVVNYFNNDRDVGSDDYNLVIDEDIDQSKEQIEYAMEGQSLDDKSVSGEAESRGNVFSVAQLVLSSGTDAELGIDRVYPELMVQNRHLCNSLKLRQVVGSIICHDNNENNLTEDECNLHTQTLIGDFKVMTLQVKFTDDYFFKGVSLAIPVPFPGQCSDDNPRCICAQCCNNYRILLYNYSIITQYRSFQISNMYSKSIDSSISDQHSEADCSLPLKKRKSLTIPTEEPVINSMMISYPNEKMYGLGDLESLNVGLQNEITCNNLSQWNDAPPYTTTSQKPLNLTKESTVQQTDPPQQTKGGKRKYGKRRKSSRK